MQLNLKKYTLTLKHTFSISRESYDSQDTLIVSLSSENCTGYGEATANQYYGISCESMIAEIEDIRLAIEAYNFHSTEDFYSFIASRGLSNFAICALDLAAHDLYGKIIGKPLY